MPLISQDRIGSIGVRASVTLPEELVSGGSSP
jgi:hypothetical protein